MHKAVVVVMETSETPIPTPAGMDVLVQLFTGLAMTVPVVNRLPKGLVVRPPRFP